jgi:hypothetical protein
MTTDYEKQLEEEVFSLKNLLDERTKELDEAKKEIQQWRDGLKHNQLFSGLDNNTKNIFLTKSNIDSDKTFHINAPFIGIGNTKLSGNDVDNLHHLWSLYIQKENNPPLLYRIWRKITSCLTTKKS